MHISNQTQATFLNSFSKMTIELEKTPATVDTSTLKIHTPHEAYNGTWQAMVEFYWKPGHDPGPPSGNNYSSRKGRNNFIRPICKDLQIDLKDISHRTIQERTTIYFRNKDDGVNFYFTVS